MFLQIKQNSDIDFFLNNIKNLYIFVHILLTLHED